MSYHIPITPILNIVCVLTTVPLQEGTLLALGLGIPLTFLLTAIISSLLTFLITYLCLARCKNHEHKTTPNVQEPTFNSSRARVKVKLKPNMAYGQVSTDSKESGYVMVLP